MISAKSKLKLSFVPNDFLFPVGSQAHGSVFRLNYRVDQRQFVKFTKRLIMNTGCLERTKSSKMDKFLQKQRMLDRNDVDPKNLTKRMLFGKPC